MVCSRAVCRVVRSPLVRATGDNLARFAGDNLARDQALIDELKMIVAGKQITPSQLAIAWVMAKRSNIVPVIGARTRTHFAESPGAMKVTLSEQDLALIEAAAPLEQVAGTRYDPRQMQMLDSEK